MKVPDISGYTIGDKLGEGSLSTVYTACRDNGEEVAVKIIQKTPFIDDRQMEFVLRNFYAVRTITNHQSIVTIFEVDSVSDCHYVVMELVKGPGTLEDVLANGALATDRGLRFGLELAQALAHAHRYNIVHGDLKPGNILVNQDDEVRLNDFFGPIALARSVPDVLGSSFVGTPKYMSPAQTRGAYPSLSSDIYSLGVVLYEILTGRLPYEVSEGINVQQMFRIVAESETILPSSVVPQLAGPTERVLMKMLAKEEEERYRTMREVEADFTALLAGDEISIPEPEPEPKPSLWQRIRTSLTGKSRADATAN